MDPIISIEQIIGNGQRLSEVWVVDVRRDGQVIDLDLTRFDGHLTSPRLGAEVFDDIPTEGNQLAT